MNPKPIIIAICCVIAIVVGVYCVGRYTLKQNSTNTSAPVQEDLTAEDPHEIVWTIESLQGPLTDLEKQLLKTPLPAPDETGTPRPFGALTRQEQNRVIVEHRAIQAEVQKMRDSWKQVNADAKAGILTPEEVKKWREDYFKRNAALRARVEALPRSDEHIP